ncbi:TIGR02530 family flagellar biosynthesis protein [Lysinibacillus sp. KU-BSD001]|uniref:TIGR02530 family flagellar biosynthesis protein n=1 Tax=Lysinibacillus sp. KU-BSD001 TaxID=3141328 RepID=UPI0036E6B26D
MNKITIQHVPFRPALTPKHNVQETQIKSFHEHFRQAQQELKISKHASERMQERNIEISEAEWQEVTDRVFEARDKGVKQPLVLMEQAALIVSAKNATVITAMDRYETKSQLFTNIDGTIVL